MPVQASGFDAFAKSLGYVSFIFVDAFCQGVRFCWMYTTQKIFS